MISVVDGLLGPVPAIDRASWYGDAVFESFRTFDGRVLALDARLERLALSCARLGFAPPPEDLLRLDLRRALEAFGAFESADAYVRVSCTRGMTAPGLLPIAGSTPRRSVFVGPLPSFPKAYAERGVAAVTQPSAVSPAGTRAAGAKTSCYVEPMLALMQAKAAGVDDGIAHDRDGVVLEATTSNVLCWDGEVVSVVPPALGVLPGITAAVVTGIAREAGYEVRARCFTVHDLYRAREIVLTSSIRGVVAVTEIV